MPCVFVSEKIFGLEHHCLLCFDPETISGGNGGNAYPLSSTWSFGLSLTL